MGQFRVINCKKMVPRIVKSILLFQIIAVAVAPESRYSIEFDGGLVDSVNSAAAFKLSFDSRYTSLIEAISSTISAYSATAKSTFEIYPEAYNTITNHVLAAHEDFLKKWPNHKNNTILQQLSKEIEAGKLKIPTRMATLEADLATLHKNFVTENIFLKSLHNESNEVTRHLYDEKQNYTCVQAYSDTMLHKMNSILGLITSNFANQNFLERDGVNKYSNTAGGHVRTLASHAFFVTDICLSYPEKQKDKCLSDTITTISSITSALQDLDKLFDGYYSILKEEANLRSRLNKFVTETDLKQTCFKKETGTNNG